MILTLVSPGSRPYLSFVVSMSPPLETSGIEELDLISYDPPWYFKNRGTYESAVRL